MRDEFEESMALKVTTDWCIAVLSVCLISITFVAPIKKIERSEWSLTLETYWMEAPCVTF